MRSKLRALWCLLVAGALCTPADRAEIKIDSNTFGSWEARSIGPAVMSGRIASLDAVQQDSLTVYVGAASGGVWKSVDGGVTFSPVFDEYTQSIGAVKIDPGDPETVWVGTGEPWTRNSVSVGDGVYKTTDGGDSWEHVGLEGTERIADILVHPTEGDTVYVCATGHLWDSNEERGVYRTRNGGKTWERVLYVDEDTGCSDLAIDPQDPRILFAGMWQFRRLPWFFSSGGPGSGLYKSTDGGDSWRELTRGLPTGDLGRIAVAVAPSRPSVVYAYVESDQTSVYRSDDVGVSWIRRSSAPVIRGRPFYFSLLLVDPSDFNLVYKPGFILSFSTDGGETFSARGGTHPDHHALWINPEDPRHLLAGTDGGLYVSYDAGIHWRFVRDLPISQFYRVSYDMEFPYNVFGGLQDNGSWMGPSRSVGGIQNRDWRNVGFGDGFYTFRDPADPDFLYSEYQGGKIRRLHLPTGETRDIQPYPGPKEDEYRFNWNTPIHFSPSDPGRMYFGAQYLFRSEDRGESWKKISPDLTTNDPEKQRQEESGGLTIDNSTAENHCTIYAISESPEDERVIWVGTDDGNLQLTRDGGTTWENVVAGIPDLPANTWVSSVEASRNDAATAYATFDGHRTGDMATYLFVTEDFGKSWRSLTTADIAGYAHVIREDPENPDLLFLGTEFGLYVTLDRGKHWARFEGNLPKVGVRDLAVHPREGDLIIGTHGRGIYILDDLTPLRRLRQETLEADVVLLDSRPAIMMIPAGIQNFGGPDEFVGRNPSETAVITYYMKRRHIFGDLKLEIYDADGELLRVLPGTKRRGINRVLWPMRLKPPQVPPASRLVPAFQGPRVAEGKYEVRLIKGDTTVEGSFELVADPRSLHSAEDRAYQQQTAMQLYRLLERLTFLIDSLIDLREQADERREGLRDSDKANKSLTAFAERLEALRESIVAFDEAGEIRGQEKLREKLGSLYGSVVGFDGRPTRSQLDNVEVLSGKLEEAEAAFAILSGTELAGVNKALARTKLEPLAPLSLEAWKERQE